MTESHLLTKFIIKQFHYSHTEKSNMSTINIQKKNPDTPVKLAILCCDSPQHFDLIERLHKEFEVQGVVMETDKNQMDWLWKKGRYKLWFYRRYHSIRRRWMGHSAHRKSFFPTTFDLETSGIPTHYAFNINERATAKFLKKIKPDITIVCGTMYVGKRARKAGNNIINLHGGVLPEYKGNQCIFFALHEKAYDKIGATIHLVTEVLDGGSVISIVKPQITPNDNDETLYAKSIKLCILKLIDLLKTYDSGESLTAHSQPPSKKKTFSHKDRTPWVELKHAIDRWSGKSIPKEMNRLPTN